MKKPILGVTLYSFTNEWQQRLYTLEQLVEKVARLDLGPAVEVVGFQSFRTFPDVPDDFAGYFRDLLEKNGLFPSCLGANLDFGRRKDRLMNDDEKIAYIERQIVSARKLGFPVMRIQHTAGAKVLEALEPAARAAGVQLACELHSPLSADNPDVIELRERFDRIGSEYLGFIPDFSATMTAVPEGHWENLRRSGAPEALIAEARAIWKTDDPTPVKFGALAAAADRFKVGPAAMSQLNLSMTMFGHAPVDSWRELLPYARHIHGKFYHVDEKGSEPSIPYPALMSLLTDAGYGGTISAEWEGTAFTEEAAGFEEVQRWRAMGERLLAD